jgi:hypothetical protein
MKFLINYSMQLFLDILIRGKLVERELSKKNVLKLTKEHVYYL